MIYFEDIHLEEVRVAGPFELTKQDIVEFASKWDPFPFHTDVAVANKSIFGGLTASNCHTVCIACRLFHNIETPAVLAALGHEYQYPNPARVGDQLTLESRHISKRESKSRNDRGIVEGHTQLKNQDGTVVLEMKSIVMVAKRD